MIVRLMIRTGKSYNKTNVFYVAEKWECGGIYDRLGTGLPW